MKNYKDLLNELPSKSVVFTFGSFNPPSVGHEFEIKVVRKLAKQRKADHVIFVSSVQDKKNPLEVSKKVQYLELFFPNTKFFPVKEETKSILDVVKSLNGKYKNIVFVVGSSKVNDYKKLLQQHNGKQYRFETIDVVSVGSTDPDLDDKLRTLASKGNFLSFKNNLPTTARDLDAKRLMNDIRIGLGLEPIKEQINLVKDSLREQYFRGEIFNENDIVESEEKVYQIIKRGSNHLLLQDETGAKVSKWIQDVKLTERTFMLNENLLNEDDQKAAHVGGSAGSTGSSAGAKTAENQRKMLELKAKQAKQIEDVKERQERETAMAKDSMKENYSFNKTLMSLHDFRKTMSMGAKPINVDNDKETESDIDASAHATCSPDHTNVGGQHMAADDNHSLRRMRVKYHLGEETKEEQADRKAQLKRFGDQSKMVNVDKVHAAGQEPHEEKWEKFKEEFGFEEDELENLVEADLESLNEDDFLEAYDDEELVIIDEETGEEIEAVAEEAELDSDVLLEVLSRAERIRARARMRRSKAKRERRHQVAIRQLSTPQVANKRARRLAISAMKKRLLQGRNPYKVSIGEKERVERFIAQRKKIVDRLSSRMVSRVKQIEKARLQHKKFTKPNNGVAF